MAMTSRERVRTALNHQEPDRVPFLLAGCTSTGITLKAYEALTAHLGIDPGPIEFASQVLQTVKLSDKVSQALGIDIKVVAEKAPASAAVYDEKTDTIHDEWGIKWHRPVGSLYYDIINAPLEGATIDDLDSFPWPDPDHPARMAGVLDEAKAVWNETGLAIFGDTPGDNLFEMAWGMRGMEQFLKDMVINKDFVHALMRRITDIQIRRAENYLSQVGDYIEIFRCSDDLGTQNSLMMSPMMYREQIKPYHVEYFSRIHELSRAKIMFHCCGSIYPLLEDLIEAGVDIINPVQVSCANMSDTAKLKAEFGDRLSFCGGIDSQHITPKGAPADVEAEVRRRIMDLAPGGGYLLNQVHTIQPDVPPENIVAIYEAGRKYGRYPLGG